MPDRRLGQCPFHGFSHCRPECELFDSEKPGCSIRLSLALLRDILERMEIGVEVND